MNKELRYFASKGDMILESVILEILAKYSVNKNPHYDRELKKNLVSNIVISEFNPQFKLRKTNYTAISKLADLVEARIWFLYINYGIDSVKRYVLKNLDLFAKKTEQL